MSIDLIRAVKAPFASEGWFLKSIIGGILMIIPFANFIVSGYLIKYMKNVLGGEDQLPDFSNMGTSFVNGIKITIGTILLVIPFVVIFIIIMMAIGSPMEIITKLAEPQNQLLMQLLASFLGFFFYIMQLNFSLDCKISSMIDFPRASKFLQNNVTGFIMLVIYMVITSILYSILMIVLLITIVGSLLVPAVLFLQLCAINNLVAQFGKNAPKFQEIISEVSV